MALTEKEKEFNRDIELLQEKYSYILENKTNRQTGEPPDLLTNHFIRTDNNNGVNSIGFRNDTYLPKQVQDEIKVLFTKHFSSK